MARKTRPIGRSIAAYDRLLEPYRCRFFVPFCSRRTGENFFRKRSPAASHIQTPFLNKATKDLYKGETGSHHYYPFCKLLLALSARCAKRDKPPRLNEADLRQKK